MKFKKACTTLLLMSTISSVVKGDTFKGVKLTPEDCTPWERLNTTTNTCDTASYSQHHFYYIATSIGQMQIDNPEVCEGDYIKDGVKLGKNKSRGDKALTHDAINKFEIRYIGPTYSYHGNHRDSSKIFADVRHHAALLYRIRLIAPDLLDIRFGVPYDNGAGASYLKECEGRPQIVTFNLPSFFYNHKLDWKYFSWERFINAVVHEHGHSIFLSVTQRLPQNGTYACNDKIIESKTYEQLFYQRFLADEMDKIKERDGRTHKKTNRYCYYLNHPNEFINPLVVGDTVEDMAYTWTQFVLRERPRPDSGINKKILFFYEFPELVAKRDRVRAAILNGIQAQLELPTEQK